MFYLLIGLIIAIFTLISVSKERSSLTLGVREFNYATMQIFLPIFLIVIGGCRWFTGSDWNNYYRFYSWHDSWESYNNGEFEILYTLLNFICHKICPDYTFFLIIFTFLLISLKVYAWNKIGLHYFGITFFLWYCYTMGDITAVRQDLSIAFLFLSIPSIINKDIKKFICLSTIAVCIHNASIVWYLSYFVYWRHYKSRRKDIMRLIICFLIGFFGIHIYGLILNGLIGMLPASGRIYGKILAYSVSKSNVNYIGVLFNILKRIIIFPFLFYYEDKIKLKCKWYSGLLSLYIFGSCIYFLFLTSFQVFQRFTNPFLILECLLLAEVYGAMNKKNKKFFFIFLILYGFMKLYKSITTLWYVKMPYYSIFNYHERFMDWDPILEKNIKWSF